MMERRFGKIVNIASIAAKLDPLFLQPYAAAKTLAIESYTNSGKRPWPLQHKCERNLA